MNVEISRSINDLKSAAGSEVNFVRFSYQIDINFYCDRPLAISGRPDPVTYWGLQFEKPFQLNTGERTLIVDPKKPEPQATLALVDLIHDQLVSVKIPDEQHLELLFARDAKLVIDPSSLDAGWSLVV